jgi:hypothetical protein
MYRFSIYIWRRVSQIPVYDNLIDTLLYTPLLPLCFELQSTTVHLIFTTYVYPILMLINSGCSVSFVVNSQPTKSQYRIELLIIVLVSF